MGSARRGRRRGAHLCGGAQHRTPAADRAPDAVRRVRGGGAPRDGELPRLLARVVAAVDGAVALFAVGWFIYWLVVGFSPDDMVRPTINFIRMGPRAASWSP